jgi:hypothetical protein
MSTVEEKIRRLPPSLRQEAEDFVDFLIEKQSNRPRGTPTLDWAGALKDLRSEYTSVELQHQISEWRIEKE